MPSPYELIRRASQKKTQDHARRADRWVELQTPVPQKQTQVAPPQEPTQPQDGYTASSYPSFPVQQTMQPTFRHPNLDAIHKRHSQAAEKAAWRPVEQPRETAVGNAVKEGKT